MKILLADDHQLFLEGMQSVLAEIASHTIACENNGHDALRQLSENLFDIALIDLRLPSVNGFSLLTELALINCLTPIIIVTASEDPQDVQLAIDLGAMGFVPKSSNSQQIIKAIECVLMGEIVRPGSHCHPNDTMENKQDWASQHNLTQRQLEVLRLIGHGLSNQAIADKLFLSIATVKTHIVAIFQALKTQNRTEAIKKAHQLGLD